ncbi:MAG: RNA pseudouridine synthase [Verrucomicrobia bacterium]|nr:RNA pseudouridine synthase [Verrucomicrobiota bacterium]MBS0645808.1 RNA pseudouridine synthase [Verrucomicrobiota bacterium]
MQHPVFPTILFCDNHILIAIKPPGMLTQPDHTSNKDLETFAKAWVKQKFQKPGNVFLHAIHRIDRPVSGLVVFARTSKALSRLNEQIRNKKIQRFYLAQVEGQLHKDGILEHYLVHQDHYAEVCSQHVKDAKLARLSYHILQSSSHSTTVHVELETGRYHQIRAQFAAIGHPIEGDIRYGSKTSQGLGICLQCIEMSFEHPVTQEMMTFDLHQALKRSS